MLVQHNNAMYVWGERGGKIKKEMERWGGKSGEREKEGERERGRAREYGCREGGGKERGIKYALSESEA